MNEIFLWIVYLFLMPAFLGTAVVIPFAIMLWLRMARDVPYWWTLLGILSGAAVAQFALTPEWEVFLLSRQVIGAGIGGLIADAFWLLLRKTGHAG